MLPFLILKVKMIFEKAGDKERGQTLVEYALALAIIAVVTIGVLVFLSISLSDSYETMAFSFPDVNLFGKPLSLGHMRNDQGNIQWFIIDN